MNTIKFSKLKNITTEQHDLEVETFTEEDIYEHKILLQHPCNLNIFVTNICQNDCFFCINGRNHKIEDEISNERYYELLEKCLSDLQGKDIEITVTGGDPTLIPSRFIKTMLLCKKYGYPCRTVSTTGLRLLEEFKGKPLCQYMIENGFIHNINISRMHFEESRNKEILNGANLTNEEISKLAYFFSTNNADMRISCNIMNGYIDSMNKMLEFVSYYERLGIETFMFRELVMENPLLLSSILDFKDFEKIEILHGDNYEVNVYIYKDYLVKHYKMINTKQEHVNSMSFKNGILRIGFNGEVLKNFCE